MVSTTKRDSGNCCLRLGILSLLLVFVTMLARDLPAQAADSALSGLGEPAAPESMASPTKLFPASSSQTSPGVSVSPTPTSTPPPKSTGGISGTQPAASRTNVGAQQVGSPVLLRPAQGGAAPSSSDSSFIFRPHIEKQETGPLTLKGAIDYADQNYPTIKKGIALVTSAQQGVTLQKLNEYLPDSLFQYQLLMSSHNKITEMFYGSPVFPADAGPGINSVSMQPYFYSGAGFSIDWAPIDFGLHKARIQYSKSQYRQSQAGYEVTKLDVQIATASAFLDVVQAMEQVRAMEENVASFTSFYDVVHAQVNASLKPGADQSLAVAQLANAQNQLLRAQLSEDLAIATLANTMGLGGESVHIEPKGIAGNSEPREIQKAAPVFENVPIVKASQAVLSTAMAQRRVLNKEYAPVFHFLGGFNLRGSGQDLAATGRQSQGGSGVFPVVPNYQVAMIVNWNFLDWFRIRQQKRIQDQRIIAQQQDLNLVLQNIRTEDVKARAQIKTAVALAANMPVQVEASAVAVNQAQARYQTGLGSVAQVAEANTVLAQSRMQEAIARVGVWRAMLQVSSVHGDLRPFIAEADRIQKGM
jgi:outer membrane protein